MSTAQPQRRSWWRNETLQGALVLVVLLCVFFGTPLRRFSEVYYSSADLTQDFNLTKIEPGHESGNKLMSDAVTQMQPWFMLNRDELHKGRIPWWNPYNGNGCPHFANYQSAVFSIFSVPYYIFDFKTALLSSAFLKLFALGFFTFLFLKEIGLRQIPALTGATAFMFGGHNVLLISFPHVGAMVALPAGFYFSERAFKKFDAALRALPSGATAGEIARTARVFWPLVGLTLSLTAGLLAGNPEPFYFCVALLAPFIVARLIGLALRHRARVAVLKLGLRFLLAGVLAAGMSAFQILPFFEYLSQSRVLEQRSDFQTPLTPEFWPLAMFPNVLGNPSTQYYLSYTVPPPNFEHTNSVYTGGLVVYLALLCLLFVRRDRFAAFFTSAAIVWALYAYNFFGLSRWFALIPSVDRAPMNRSQGIWIFCLACAAAIALDHLMRAHERRRFNLALITGLGALAFLAAHLIGADRLVEKYSTYESPNHYLYLVHVPSHLVWVSKVFVVGALAASVLWLVHARWLKWLGGCAVLAVVFLHTGWLFRDYNPVTENRFFFPVTPAMAQVQRIVGKELLAVLGEDGIPPTSNLAYGLQIVNNYDGMWIRDYDHLYRMNFGDSNNWRPILKSTERSLKIFGIQYVIAKWGWIPTDSGLSKMDREDGQRFITHEIVPNQDVSQTFKVHDNGLQAVAIVLGTHPNAKPCTIDFTLEDQTTGEVVATKTMSTAEVRADIYSQQHVVFASELHVYPQGRFVVFDFPRIAASKNHVYKFTLSSKNSSGGNAIDAYSTPLLAYGEGTAMYGNSKLAGEVLFDFSFNLDSFEKVATLGDFGLYRFKNALPKFHTVGGAVIAETDREAIELLRVPTFDPRRLVVLSTDDPEAVNASTAMGPRDNSKARLIKTRESVKVYVVGSDGKSIVHVEDEATFLANKFKWSQIEIVTQEEFDKYTIVEFDMEAAKRVGMRVVAPDVPDVTPLRVLDETPTRARIAVDRAEPGYLVIAQANYPGWKARVNGVEKKLWRANFAFSAVYLERGPSEIEFYYDPPSLKLGLSISGACALAGVALLFLRRAKRPLAAA